MGNGRFYQTLSVEVDIDSSVLEENGYHHEEDCEKREVEVAVELEGTRNNKLHLRDWHDEKHGLRLWSGCVYEPCRLLTADFRTL